MELIVVLANCHLIDDEIDAARTHVENAEGSDPGISHCSLHERGAERTWMYVFSSPEALQIHFERPVPPGCVCFHVYGKALAPDIAETLRRTGCDVFVHDHVLGFTRSQEESSSSSWTIA